MKPFRTFSDSIGSDRPPGSVAAVVRWLCLCLFLLAARPMCGQSVEISPTDFRTDADGLPVCCLLVPSETVPAASPMLYPRFEKVSGEEFRQLKPILNRLPAALQTDMQTAVSRKQEQRYVTFCPYVREGHRVKRLVSFEWNLSENSSVLAEASYAAGTFPATRAAARVQAAPAGRYTASSRFGEGGLTRLSLTEDGVYKLSYDDIRSLGLSPEKVQIYGYGGHLLAEDFSKPYTDDLPEIPIYKDEAGQFILFYAQGLTYWKYDTSNRIWTRVTNHYANEACYFVGERPEGSIVAGTRHTEGGPSQEINSYIDCYLYEKDLVNLGSTGRNCYGEDFTSTKVRRFDFDLSGYCEDETARLMVNFAARSAAQTTASVFLNEIYLGGMSFAAISADETHVYGSEGRLTADFTPDDDQLEVAIQYNAGNSLPKAANLDYIVLNVPRKLELRDAELLFREPASATAGLTVECCLAGADSHTLVFDVSDPLNMMLVDGTLGSDGVFRFPADASTVGQYVAVNTAAALPRPTIEDAVPAQNLHGLSPAELIIISHPDFLAQGERLAQAHRELDGLRCHVVTTEQVYNEFSSGTPDATAYRRFLKMFYDRAETEEDLPQSLLLLGDGVYDNRLVTTQFASVQNPPNKILTYQSENSLVATSSYVTDDYFGFLDDGEGSNLVSARMDIGVGRFPVRTLAEAQTAVDKTLTYMQNNDPGTWKNTLLFLSDDGDNNKHLEHANTLAETVKWEHPEFMVNKVFVDAYQRELSASGTTVPDANRRFSQLLSSGLLMLNYSGHGSTTAWAEEALLTITDIKEMQNKRLPLWITATCDFCRYDDHETSGGEYVFLNADGGAIAMITTTRVVYSDPNFTLNQAIIRQLFQRKDGQRLSLGEVLRLAKQTEGQNKLNFTLIGDPALRLAYPGYRLQIDSINGHTATGRCDTLGALSQVRMSGHVLRPEGDDYVPDDSFDGVVQPTVFDAEETVSTLGYGSNEPYSYLDRSRILFSGKASVADGRFEFSFIVPKDQSYSYQTGLVNLYAYSNDGQQEAQGVFEGFCLGGTDESARRDTLGPLIRLFLNDTLFTDGGDTHQTPVLLAFLQDSSGLNTSGNGIGHDLSLVIDDNLRYNLNSAYESDLNSAVSGSLCYHLPELDEGLHRLTLKAWDMQNNSSTATLGFRVVKDLKPVISDCVFCQDAEGAHFVFTHNRPDQYLDLELRVCDLQGRLLWQESRREFTAKGQAHQIDWNYVGQSGRQVENGLYICRLYLSSGGTQETVRSEKIKVGIQ